MNGPETRLLVSVRNAAEARVALAAGAHWIDLKEPARGPLGAVDAQSARAAAIAVADRAPLSAAAGELVDWPASSSRDLLAVDGVKLLKLGLAHCRATPWQAPWMAAHREVALHGKDLAAVIYADRDAASSPEPAEVLDVARRAGATWLLVDTFDKSGPPLGCHFTLPELTRLLVEARDSGLRTAVAGRLTLDTISTLPLHLVDFVAVRGAACQGQREGAISRRRVAALCAHLERRSALSIPSP